MKRFLLFLVVAIAVVSLGLTIYYFSTDNEVIRINNAYVTLNKNALLKTSDLLTIENQSEYTTIDYSEVGDSEILEYSENDGWYEAKKGGKTNITIRTSNRHYSSIVIEVTVNDGSEANPFAIFSEAELRKIGDTSIANNQYTADMCYKQYEDIVLTSEWEPIENFTGIYDGGNHVIYDMTVTKNTQSNNAGFVGTLGVNNINGHARQGKQGVIKNLKLSNVSIKGLYENAGAFAGVNNGKIQVCQFISGKVETTFASDAYLGGIAGKVENVGKLRPTVDRCVVDGIVAVDSQDLYIGGLVGYNHAGQISESAFRGYVETADAGKNYSFGGLVALNKDSAEYGANIYDSYAYIKSNTKSIGTDNLAAIVHTNEETSTNKNTILGCYYGGELVNEATTKAVISTPNDDNIAVGYLTKEKFKLQENFISYEYLVGSDSIPVAWNFETVWFMGDKYPEISETSELGTVYMDDIDVDNIINTGNKVQTIQELHTKLVADAQNTAANTYYVLLTEESVEASKNYVWEPVDNFYGTIVFAGASIKNFYIENKTAGENTGLFKRIDKNAVISGLNIDYVTIKGEPASNVGVIAGVNDGANVSNITIKNVFVEVEGSGNCTFGTLFGISKDYAGHGIKNVKIKNVEMKTNFYTAGGVVGVNYSTISNGPLNGQSVDPNEILVNNMVQDVNLIAKRAGGVVGENKSSGIIEKTTAVEIVFNQTVTENPTLFTSDIGVGGIVGANFGGTISNVYVIKSNLQVPTGASYNVYLGGVVGTNANAGVVVRAYVANTKISTTSNYVAIVGGVVGDNQGAVNLCVVDKATEVKSSTTFVALNNTTANSANLTFTCSMVGGIAGFNRAGSAVAITQCASMASVEGFYAGGLVGISYANISKSSFGYVDGGTAFRVTKAKVTGFYAGGLVSLAVSGTVSDCYTICDIIGATFTGKSADWTKVTLNTAANMVCSQEVSAKAGFSVFVINKAVIKNCYAVVDFSSDGINFATTLTEVQRSDADRAKYNYGTLKNCAYQTYGNYNNGGTRLTQEQFQGGGNNYKAFIQVGFDTTTIWDIKTNGGAYPRFYKISTQLPQAPTAY